MKPKGQVSGKLQVINERLTVYFSSLSVIKGRMNLPTDLIPNP